ncbi:MAG TPA: glycerol-3-phosphate dehydrogenase/oxidase [Motilibacterales bacterium]|nr:glycerol-3-phosphate dehydrogenase/oxidase [Motilibacterales bacterium]
MSRPAALPLRPSTARVAHLAPGDPSTLLTRDRRARWRTSLEDGAPLDVLVVGGGITGVGVALDAASRGLRVALVERDDLASGTSRWSSKLVHGGLRYLASGQVGVAWESARERAVLAGVVAPHLIHPLPQVVPFSDAPDEPDPRLVRGGLTAADVLRAAARTPRGMLPRARSLDADHALALVPCLAAGKVRGAMVLWDCQLEDDVRLVVAVARTAAAYGAAIMTRTEVLSIGPGRAQLRDGLDGSTYTVRAGHIVNATGAWAHELDDAVRLVPSRGSHVVVRSERLGNPSAALTVPVPGASGRFVFALPQSDGLTFIGLTDVPMPGPVPRVATPTQAEIDWILGVISPWLEVGLTRDDVVGSFAGVRPLAAPEHESPSDSGADLSRRHVVRDHGDGRITVTGGKLTTYRRMAQDVVDLITDVPCRTARIAVVGAAGAGSLTRVDPAVPARLARRYGSEAGTVWSLGESRPWLREPVAEGVPVLGVELAFGVEAEGALDVADLLERRTRLSLVPADLAAGSGRARAAAESCL